MLLSLSIEEIWKEIFGVRIGQCRNCWAKGYSIRFIAHKESNGLWTIECPRCGWTSQNSGWSNRGERTVRDWFMIFPLLFGNPPEIKEE